VIKEEAKKEGTPAGQLSLGGLTILQAHPRLAAKGEFNQEGNINALSAVPGARSASPDQPSNSRIATL